MKKSVRERLEAMSTPEPNSGCLLWLGKTVTGGYGYICVDGRSLLAHRVSYEQEFGEIPHGLTLDHKCRVRCCINPRHLEPVTHAENTRRRPKNRERVTLHPRQNMGSLIPAKSCGSSHMKGGNVGIRKDGRKFCWECQRLSSAAWRRRSATSKPNIERHQ